MLREFPLSRLQLGIWYSQAVHPTSAQFLASSIFRLRSPQDVTAMQSAWRALFVRHPGLRTTFHEREGGPVQLVHPEFEPSFRQVDMRGASDADVRAAFVREHATPLDLGREGCARMALFTRAPDDHILTVTKHHIGTDLESGDVIQNEFLQLYAHERTGAPLALPVLQSTYADYVALENELLEKRGDELRVYWLRAIGRNPPPLELPTDRPRPAIRDAAGAVFGFSIEPAIVGPLRELSRGSSFFRTLLCAYYVLLERLGGQREIIVATPSTSRSDRFDNVIGDFVNMLPMRATVSPRASFRAFLDEIRAVVTEATNHRHFPFVSMMEEAHLANDPSRTPIFQTTITLWRKRGTGSIGECFDVGQHAVELHRLVVEPQYVPQQLGQLDVSMWCGESEGRLHCELKYDPALWSESSIRRMADNWRALLESVVKNPDAAIGALDARTEEEKRSSARWNATDVRFDREGPLHALFERQVDRTPDAVAVVDAKASITYRELDRRANRLAHHLRSLGVGPEVRVGLRVERSIEMVVGILGILKAGGAYAPLDPSYPAERLTQMIADLAAPVVVTQELLGDPRIEEERDARPDIPVLPENGAYVIFTSGSTGRAKGVLVPHAAIVNHTLWMQREFPLGPKDVVLQKTPFGFDASVLEFHSPLAAGARLVMAVPDGHRDPAYLTRAIEEHGITMLQVVPTMLDVLLDQERFAAGGSLARVFCGGEALAPALVKRFRERTSIPLVNLYGPTECAIDSTFFVCSGSTASIGSPIANVTAWVLDDELRPVPIGAAGELYIGGVGLARGYIGRPDLTGERFVPSPFGRGERLYRTGDRVRRLPDGTLDFLQRVDNQVKIRGFRIELAEIEAALTEHVAVERAVVVVREDAPGEKRLVGYFISSGAPDLEELAAFLRKRLPEFMVPAAFVRVDAFPMLPSGKVDRRGLPRPAFTTPTTRVAPSTAIEETIAVVWRNVLRIDDVGVTEDLFSLGADSLQTIRIAAQLTSVLGRRVPIRLVRENPSIRAFIGALEGPTHASTRLAPLAIGKGSPLYCLHAMGGSTLAYRALANHLDKHAVWAVQASGVEAGEDVPTSIEEMASSYAAEIGRHQPEGTIHLLGWSFGGILAFETGRRLRSIDRVVKIFLVDARLPRELGDGRDEIEAARSFCRDLCRVSVPVNVLDQWAAASDLSQSIASFVASSGVMDDHALIVRLFTLYRIHFRALRSFRPEPYAGDVVLVTAKQTTPDTTPALWRELVTGAFEVRALDGDHFTVMEPPLVASIAAFVRKSMGG